MPVLALVGNKGGAGKTTLCVNLASALSARHRTIILDADPQRSSLQWRELSDRGGAVSVVDASADLGSLIRQARADHEFVLVDCPPSVHARETTAALAACDLALIPVQPSPLDIWATVYIESKVDEARAINPNLRALLVINQLEPRTKLSQLTREALGELALPVADTAIRRRVAYRSSVLDGRSVIDLGIRGKAAAAEILELVEEVLRA